jgi:hypothetical protein
MLREATLAVLLLCTNTRAQAINFSATQATIAGISASACAFFSQANPWSWWQWAQQMQTDMAATKVSIDSLTSVLGQSMAAASPILERSNNIITQIIESKSKRLSFIALMVTTTACCAATGYLTIRCMQKIEAALKRRRT